MEAGHGPTPSGLGQYTGYLLRRAYAKTRESTRVCGADDMPLRELVLVSFLAEREGISQRELGDLMHVNRSLMVKLVDGLEARGYVARERNPADRRSYALRLTQRGRRARSETLHDVDLTEVLLASALTPDETTRLKRLLLTVLADEPVEMGPLADRLGYLIAEAHRVWRTRADAVLEPFGLQPRDFGALSTIAMHQPCSQNQLAANLGVSAPMALTFVDGLEAAGLVVRARNPKDRRVHDLTLTESGTTVLKTARAAAGKLQHELAARLGATADAELRLLLGKVVDFEP